MRTAYRFARNALCAGSALGALALPAIAHAETVGASDVEVEQGEPDETPDQTIYVYGRGEQRIGKAIAASEGGIAGRDLDVRPFLRPGEILEATPGLIATQHSGGGKANQYFLRGFNLDHGTDYALYIDDVPQNLRTHGHGQGYLDVQGLIPEVVQRIDYRKGPYRADTGDFSFVGSSFIKTHDRMEPFAAVEVGQFGYRRFVAGGSAKVGGGDLLAVGQAKFNDGPWELPEDFEAYSALLKYSAPIGAGQFQASLNIYTATWNPTEQIPERAIGTPLCENAYCSLDPTQTGRTEREVLTLGYEDDDWRFTAYVQHYDWSLISNFTFFLDDPVNGDQLRQYDKRWTYGGRVERTFQIDDTISLRLGTELREDSQPRVGLDETIEGIKEFTVGAFDVKESSAGLYAEAVWRPVERMMVIGGLRGDWYRFRTKALEGANSWSGVAKDHGLFPKIGVNYEVVDGVALYANWGEGFHSNDARAATNPVDAIPGVIQGTLKELGARFERNGLILSGVYWWSDIDSELIYVGDAGAVEPNDASKRHGLEVTAFWRPLEWLAIDAVWTSSSARYVGLPEGENFVPGALKSSGELGFSGIFPEFNFAGRLRYLGPHPLVEDNSVSGESTVLFNLRAAWTPVKLKGFEIYGELLNVFDSKQHDIDYFYETRLPGEAVGVEGRNSRIVEPRQFRIGVKKTF